MVYLRVPTWKTAINPSTKHRFDQNGNFTPLQKMMLTRNRIWGNMVGGNVRSGFKELKTPMKGRYMAARYEFSRINQFNPFIKNWEKMNKNKDFT